MIYDLENNIPYITSPFKSENAYFVDFYNERNVFWDSTRNLCLDFPHMLIFSYSEREMDHWIDICKREEDLVEMAEKTGDILDLFFSKF